MPPWYQGPDPLGLGADEDDDSKSGHDILTSAATAYTKRVPEAIQVVNPGATFAARLVDRNPGATLRDPEDGPTDAYGDRRGPIDNALDTVLERDGGDAARGDFEDDSDLPGPSAGDWARNPSEGTAQLLGQSFEFARGNWQIHGENGEEPNNRPGILSGGIIIFGIVVLAVVYVVGQLFTFEVGS